MAKIPTTFLETQARDAAAGTTLVEDIAAAIDKRCSSETLADKITAARTLVGRNSVKQPHGENVPKTVEGAKTIVQKLSRDIDSSEGRSRR